MWLASSYDCVMVADVLNMAGGGEGATSVHSGASRSLLHQVVDPESLFNLSFNSQYKFVQFVHYTSTSFQQKTQRIFQDVLS
jgi:hypothetical protein